jgi:transposase
MLGEMAERMKLLDQRIRQYDSKVERVFGQDERCPRLAQVEGVGPLVATALVAAVEKRARIQKRAANSGGLAAPSYANERPGT